MLPALGLASVIEIAADRDDDLLVECADRGLVLVLVGDRLQHVPDRVQPGTELVVAAHDLPGRGLGRGARQHLVEGARIIVEVRD